MSDPLLEIAEFAGKASGTIVKDVADFSQPLADAFRRGWREAMEKKPKTEPAGEQAPDSA
ncbi:MAG: hypothetical protein ACE5G6_04835 [Terriglobia bacterium]